jgi:hypothetical protein
MPRMKYLSAKHSRAKELFDLPNFSRTGSIVGMKKLYYGMDALLVRSGSYIYNVTFKPELYEIAK